MQGQALQSYRCPFHGIGMVLTKKKKENRKGALDVWYLKCPSPISYNNGPRCAYTVKLKTVAQVLAVRQIGTAVRCSRDDMNQRHS